MSNIRVNDAIDIIVSKIDMLHVFLMNNNTTISDDTRKHIEKDIDLFKECNNILEEISESYRG